MVLLRNFGLALMLLSALTEFALYESGQLDWPLDPHELTNPSFSFPLKVDLARAVPVGGVPTAEKKFAPIIEGAIRAKPGPS